MDELALLAGEEFDALVFNALHGWYRQAIGCLRNGLETLIVGAALAVTDSQGIIRSLAGRDQRVRVWHSSRASAGQSTRHGGRR